MIIEELITRWGFDLDTEKLKELRGAVESTKRSLSDAEAGAGRFFSKIGHMGRMMTIGITMPLVGLAGGLVKAASNAEEGLNRYEVAFGRLIKDPETGAFVRDQNAQLANEMDAYIEMIHDKYGRSRSELRNYVTMIQDMFVPLGMAPKESLELAKDYLERGVLDLASFYNKSEEDVAETIRSAMLGQTRRAKMMFNVDISAKRVKAEIERQVESGETPAVNEKGVKAFDDLVVKARVAWQLIKDGTKNAEEDLIRTGDSFANQARRMKSMSSEVGEEWGKRLLPRINELITKMGELTSGQKELSDAQKDTVIDIGIFVALLGPMLLVVAALGKIILGVKLLAGAMLAAKTATAGAGLWSLIAGGTGTLGGGAGLAATAGILSAAILLIIVAIGLVVYTVVRYGKELKSMFWEAVDFYKDIFKRIWQDWKDLWRDIKKVMSESWESFKDLTGINAISDWFEDQYKGAIKWMEKIEQFYKDHLGWILKLNKTALDYWFPEEKSEETGKRKRMTREEAREDAQKRIAEGIEQSKRIQNPYWTENQYGMSREAFEEVEKQGGKVSREGRGGVTVTIANVDIKLSNRAYITKDDIIKEISEQLANQIPQADQ